MKRLGIASFTQRGKGTADRLASFFSEEYEIIRYESGLKSWCGELFASGADGILFVGACGIAVRTIAPFLKSKTTDPAVLVIDEAGQFVISLLSGHIGGANRLALRAASVLGAVPVITTATDVNGKFAVDVFASDNGLKIESMKAAKEISAAVLRGGHVGVYCGGGRKGDLPAELTPVTAADLAADSGREKLDALICISERTADRLFPDGVLPPVVLHLIPRCCFLGLGCRRGKPEEEIEQMADQAVREAGIFPEALAGAASIDLKKEEEGILSYCRKQGIPFTTFSAEVLAAVPGEFSSSAFVSTTTGVDNVCERSALHLAGEGGRLIQKKLAGHGVTAAVAMKDWSVCFEK